MSTNRHYETWFADALPMARESLELRMKLEQNAQACAEAALASLRAGAESGLIDNAPKLIKRYLRKRDRSLYNQIELAKEINRIDAAIREQAA